MENKEIFYPVFGGGCRCRRSSGCGECGGENGNTPPCASGHDPLMGMSLAMVYSPEQAFENLYEPDEALLRGTVFIALDKPFYGDGRKC